MISKIIKLRRLARRIGLKYRKTNLKENFTYLGSEYGGFFLCLDYVNSDSVVYSFGIGEDITFDLEIIKCAGCKVHAFDPTPKSLEWLSNQTLPVEFSYEGVGISNKDGSLKFAMPENPDYVSITSVLNPENTGRIIELPVKKLSTLMKEKGHTYIDVLKIDIEGSEYEVIDNILSEKIPIKQILVEFHHRFKGVGVQKTNEAIKKLLDADYKLYAISDSGEEMSFIFGLV